MKKETNVQPLHVSQHSSNDMLGDVKIEIFIGRWHDFIIYENDNLIFESHCMGYQSFWLAPSWNESQVSHPLAKEYIRNSKRLLTKVGFNSFSEWFATLIFDNYKSVWGDIYDKRSLFYIA